MYKSLMEIADLTLIRLTNTQKAVLLNIYSAQTPELAFDSTTGTLSSMNARNFLIKNALVQLNGNQLRITTAGSDVLENNGLLDETGQITDIGQQLHDAYEQQSQQYAESLIPFRLLKMLN